MSEYTTEEPTVTTGRRDDQETYSHPAFGQISVTRPAAGGKGVKLFDSAVGHNDFVSVKICSADMDRGLNMNWVRERNVLCEFMMSEAQWASFVASGMGRGTPITFRYKPTGDYKIAMVPGIAHTETMKQTFEREIRRRCKEYVAEIGALKAKVSEMADAGKATKTQLKEIVGQLDVFERNLPSNMAFTQSQFAEAMEKTTEQAKTDIESFVTNLAQRTGIDVLRERQFQIDTLGDPATELTYDPDA